MRAAAGLAGHFIFMEDDFLLCPHALRSLAYVTAKAYAYFPGPSRCAPSRPRWARFGSAPRRAQAGPPPVLETQQNHAALRPVRDRSAARRCPTLQARGAAALDAESDSDLEALGHHMRCLSAALYPMRHRI